MSHCRGESTTAWRLGGGIGQRNANSRMFVVELWTKQRRRQASNLYVTDDTRDLAALEYDSLITRHTELNVFMTVMTPLRDANSMSKVKFPSLEALAKKFLTQSASSVPVENMLMLSMSLIGPTEQEELVHLTTPH